MRSFTLTVLDAPTVVPNGDPNNADDVRWPAAGHIVVFDVRALYAFFLVRHLVTGKFTCPYFLVGAFVGGVRRNSAFIFASVIALDVEKGPTTQQAHAIFRRWQHVIYTTWSHSPDDHRFRIVIPLACDVNAEEYKLLWAWLAALLGCGADAQTKDLARALFLPAIRPDGRRAASKAWEDAPLLDPDTARPEARAFLRPPPRAPRPPRPPVTVAFGAGRRESYMRLATDAETRKRAGEYLDGRIAGNRAEDIVCPSCTRASVWFWIDPTKMKTARCKHLKSCGWWGHVSELLDGRGGANE